MPATRNRKSRSFTIQRPPPVKLRNPVQRAKTYTGCWTCRARSTKCDEARPTCLRCAQRGIVCEGYHVKLVWQDDQEDGAKPAQRRTFFTTECPLLSSRQIRSALEKVEACPFPFTVVADLFSVFPASEPPVPCNESSTPETNSPQLSACESPALCDPSDCQSSDVSQQLDQSNDELQIDHETHDSGQKSEVALAMVSIKQKVLPRIVDYVMIASSEERSLLHYWVTFLSGMMIPTQRLDNPFRTIFIPLALAAACSTEDCSGSAALLHAIYALSAFNRAAISSSPKHLEELGTKHHRISLRHLRRSLAQGEMPPSQQEAILATIITMNSIEIIKGTSTTWRTHIAGGKTWLQSLTGKQSPSFSLLRQIFFCVDALGNPEADGQNSGTPHEEPKNQMIASSMVDWNTGYCLDLLFGVTEPLLQAIIRINALSNASQATEDQKNDLELHIRRNDPDVLVSDINPDCDEITRHHTCAFFCACLIYFERRVRRTPSHQLQRLVQRSLDHLDATRILESEKGFEVCGLFWPEFITFCEAEEVNDLRARSLRLLEKGKARGIGNIISAEKVVVEVWQRRDNSTAECDVSWHDTMTDMGLDILLA